MVFHNGLFDEYSDWVNYSEHQGKQLNLLEISLLGGWF
jgi:hypothetical protein